MYVDRATGSNLAPAAPGKLGENTKISMRVFDGF